MLSGFDSAALCFMRVHIRFSRAGASQYGTTDTRCPDGGAEASVGAWRGGNAFLHMCDSFIVDALWLIFDALCCI